MKLKNFLSRISVLNLFPKAKSMGTSWINDNNIKTNPLQ